MRDTIPFSTAPSASSAPTARGKSTSRGLLRRHKYLHAGANFVAGSNSRWLARRVALSARVIPARAIPLWALIGASLGSVAAPTRAQSLGQLAGTVKAQESSIPLGAEFEIDLPPRASYQPDMEVGTGVVRVRRSFDRSKAIVEGLKDGVARVDVTWADGSVHSYRISVGSGKPQAAADASTSTYSQADAAEEPRTSPIAGRGGSLPRVLNPALPPREEPSVSRNLPIPTRGSDSFPVGPWTRPQSQLAPSRAQGRNIPVAAGLARFLGFRQNILSVYFSNPQVMDARALTARSLAVTGTAPGRSTLAINVAQSANDTVGRLEIFNIVVEPPAPAQAPSPASARDAATTEAAIQAAIYDPRVEVRVIAEPDGTHSASLRGALHNAAEESAVKSTAALFVPKVISALYVDPSAPTLSQVLNPSVPVSGESVLQTKLRQITGNDSIELISLPGTLAVKASVDSPQDAEALLSLLPTLNTRVQPFITVRGQNSGEVGPDGALVAGAAGGLGASKYYGSDRPVLNGEDLEITRRLQEVTGIRTVSVVRTAQNALAIYGTVRNRIEHETVRRYVIMLPVIGAGGGSQTQSRTFVSSSGAGAFPGAGQSVGGAAGANLNRPQFNPALAAGAGDPFFQSQAQVGGGSSGGAGTGGVGTGAVAPTAPSGAGGSGTGFGTGAVAPSAPNSDVAPSASGAGAFGTGANSFGNGGFGPGVGFGGFQPDAYFSQSTSQSNGGTAAEGALRDPINASQQPNAGYRQNVNVQMFVRITDPNQQSVRRVTLDSNIVEISRTSLRNLGVEAGTVALLSQSVTPGTPGTGPTVTINPATGQQTIIPGTPATPSITQRTVDPTLRQGVFTAATGFVGLEGLRALDPLRFRLNALYQNGNARILSRPNLSSIEGAEAQIVVGGERPVPSAVATGQAVGQSIVFRRFGIILTMRPTLLDDDTILLQIRADVTELAPEYGVNINGALIPGERVRSVNTTITVRPGDTFVLGGLITNDRRQQTSRIPILSSLPFIGSLFKSKRFENNESELAIFMTPRIDRLNVTVNGHESVLRAPALPPLPDSATGASAFGALGSAGQ